MLGDEGLVMIMPVPVRFYGCASQLKSTLKVDWELAQESDPAGCLMAAC